MTYDELIRESGENVKTLSEKLKELDKLHQDIKNLAQAPEKLSEAFQEKFQQVVEQARVYTNTLGFATKTYLDDNNILFTTKLKELSSQTKLLQIDIDELKTQVERLEKIDLETHFNTLQKTLSETFEKIDTGLSRITQNLDKINQSLNTIQTNISANHQETQSQLTNFKNNAETHLDSQDKNLLSFSEETKKHLDNQDKELSTITSKLNLLEEQNNLLKKEIKKNRIILVTASICFFVLSLLPLLSFYFRFSR
jgi:uncharacterized phage infection (PIP) family protein YhgE